MIAFGAVTNLPHRQKQEKEALDDLATELELSDEDQPVLCVDHLHKPLQDLSFSNRYKVGEAFLHMPHLQALKRLERDQNVIDTRVAALAAQADECEAEMKDLKVTLYAKFGKAINLDE
jgi:prefoldin subunit 4